MIDRNALAVTLTVGQFIDIIDSRIQAKEEPTKDDEGYSYGLQGLARLLNCSRTTANKIKQSGKLDKAIKQVGRKIIIDNEKALQLLGK